MAYHCPRCGQPVRRGASPAAGLAGGAIGALLYAAFGSFQCKDCGPIPRSEFPPDVQTKMTRGTLGLVAVAVVLVVVVVCLLVLLRPT